MKIIFSFIFLLFLISCGYPDIDNVPDFNDVLLTDDEINDYCSSTNYEMKNIEKCINDYKRNN